MNSVNDSVVICETPSPAKTTRLTEAATTDYRKRLRSSSAKNLLSTVYESPLAHFKRNKIAETETNLRLNDIAIVHSPIPQKSRTKGRNFPRTSCQRPKYLDESIVILNDIRTPEPVRKAESVVEVALSDTETNDIIEVPKARKSPNSFKAKVTPKMKKKRATSAKLLHPKLVEKKTKKAKRKVTNLSNPKTLKMAKAIAEALSVNDENHNGQIMQQNSNECPSTSSNDGEDVEVVWISGPKAAKKRKPTPNFPILIDTVPTLSNLVNPVNFKDAKKQKKVAKTNNTVAKKFGRNDSNSLPSSTNNSQQGGQPGKLRVIVIDGLNVGTGYTCGKKFSEVGLKLAIDYFKSRGHEVKAFLPQKMRAKARPLLEEMHREGTLVFTPSRRIAGKRITPYDDRFILDYATQCNGIVVSSDQYRDLWLEKPEWRNTIEKRLLTPTFAGDYLMFPEDPLGRSGPKLDEFLRY